VATLEISNKGRVRHVSKLNTNCNRFFEGEINAYYKYQGVLANGSFLYVLVDGRRYEVVEMYGSHQIIVMVSLS
jgi:hypothetical protein